MLDLAIIGGGPAGLTAGLYATRGGLDKVTMFEKGMPGGQITNSSEIENYPGVTGEITGMDLMHPWPAQCQKLGLKHELVNVIRVTKNADLFTIHKEDGTTTDAHSGTHSWWNHDLTPGNYSKGGLDNSLYTRHIDLTNARKATLSAYLKFNKNIKTGP